MLSKLSWNRDVKVDAAHNIHVGRGRPGHALPHRQGHLGMDTGSTAAHYIPRGRLGPYHRGILFTLYNCTCHDCIDCKTNKDTHEFNQYMVITRGVWRGHACCEKTV